MDLESFPNIPRKYFAGEIFSKFAYLYCGKHERLCDKNKTLFPVFPVSHGRKHQKPHFHGPIRRLRSEEKKELLENFAGA